MPPEKQTITWPLTGGLDTRTGPLAIQPGSFLTLTNVRQERTNEWRVRDGITHAAADDVPEGVPVLRTVQLPGGGVLAQTAMEGGISAVARSSAVYIPGGLAASRWLRSLQNNSSCTRPRLWQRRPTAATSPPSGTAPPGGVSYAAGIGVSLTAWWYPVGQVKVSIQSRTEGESLTESVVISGNIGTNTPVRARCAYTGSGDYLLLCWVELATGDVKAQTFNGSTGASVAGPTTIGTGAHATDPYIDAVYYTGTNITVVFRTAGSQIRFLEVTPSTLATPTSAAVAVNCNTCLSLLQDPDASTIRTLATYDTAGTALRIVRLNSAGAIQTNDAITEATAVEQAAGVSYSGGAGWLVVYETAAALKACKKRSGAVSAVFTVNDFTAGRYSLATGAWREPSSDPMRYMVRYRGGEGGGGVAGSFVDPQRTYYELAIEFENASASITNIYTQAQSRLLAFEASSNLQNASLAHAVRISQDVYETALVRLLRFDIAASVEADQWAIDRWQVTYLNAANTASANLGEGVSTGTTAYLPDGMLLQSGNGDLVCGHGGTTVPVIASLTAGAGGGLTPSTTYQYIATEDLGDDAGNVWHGPQSTAQQVVLGGAQNRVTIQAWFGVHEIVARKRTVKFWRTNANGSVFRLVYSATGTCVTSVVSFTDNVSDTTLNTNSEFLPGDVPNGLTPAFSHIALFGNRLWGIDRDFPQTLWFSKPLQAGLAPEFPEQFSTNVEDVTGSPTAFGGMDDKLVLFKRNAVYVSAGETPDNTGAGQFPSWTRTDSDVGSVGTHVVSTGDAVYYASQRGLHRLNRSLEVTWFQQLDQYFNQPQIGAPETIIGAVFSPQTNEVRFQAAQSRFIYDRELNIWVRDTGGVAGGVIAGMIGSTQAFFASNGAVKFEDLTGMVTTDDGATITGLIRSPWIGAIEGWFRLYRVRVLGLRLGGVSTVTPGMAVFYDHDDTITQATTGTILAGTTAVRGEMRLTRQRCTRFSVQLTLTTAQQVRLEAWAAQIGIKRSVQPLAQANRWT